MLDPLKQKGLGHFFMTVYIEYAFLENFVFDGGLLLLTLFALKVPIKARRVLFSALFGAFFALIYPFLHLPKVLSLLLKIAVGLALCLLAFGRVKTKKEWGRYALTALLFFALSFAYGGTLTALTSGFFKGKVPSVLVLAGFLLFAALVVVFTKKLYEKRALYAFIYDCAILYNQRRVAVLGYLDSGNLATKNDLPVCFVSPDIFYDLCGKEIVCGEEKDGGQVCDELQIRTLAGERKVPLCRGELEIKTPTGERTKKEVYFAMAANMISRDYKLLLQARILEG